MRRLFISIVAASIVVAATVAPDSLLGSGKHYHETGAFTFTLAQESGVWKIAGQVWTVLPKSVE